MRYLKTEERLKMKIEMLVLIRKYLALKIEGLNKKLAQYSPNPDFENVKVFEEITKTEKVA